MSEVSPLGETKGSQRSLNLRPNYGTQEGWSQNSSSRCNDVTASICRHAKSDLEKESLLTSSLPNSPSISLVDGQYKRNEVVKILATQPINKPNESDKGMYSFPPGLGGCSGMYEDDWQKKTVRGSSTTHAENSIRSNTSEVEDDRLALMHPKSICGASS